MIPTDQPTDQRTDSYMIPTDRPTDRQTNGYSKLALVNNKVGYATLKEKKGNPQRKLFGQSECKLDDNRTFMKQITKSKKNLKKNRQTVLIVFIVASQRVIITRIDSQEIFPSLSRKEKLLP